MTLSVYDCLPGISFAGLQSSYAAQQDGPIPTIKVQAKLAEGIDEDCRITGYKIIGQTEEMTMDELKGELTISTSGPLKESIKAQVIIGSQSYTSGSFSMEIFNCNGAISFPDLLSRYLFQFGETVGGIQLEAQSSKPSQCVIESYALEGETQGTTIDPESGVMSVDTSAVISPSPRKISVKVGSQTMISPEFTFEVFDCRSFIEFTGGILKQVGSTTSVFPAIKSISRKQCKATSFSLKVPIEGISIDASSGEITISTRKVIPKSQLTIEAVVGSQTVTNEEVIELEVYDCTTDLTFAPSVIAQVGQATQKFLSVTINKPREECKDFTYSLTGSPIGIQMNEQTSEIIIQTTSAIKKTSHEVTVQVGSQQIQSPSFDIEVFDCKLGLVFAQDIQIQVGSPPKQVDVIQSKPPHPNCATIQFANVKGLKDGIKLSAQGVLKVDTVSEIEESKLEADVIIGVQEFKIDQKIEVFDCLSKIDFLKQYQAQLQSDSKFVETVVKLQRKDDCAIQSFTTVSSPSGFTVDPNTGQIKVATDNVIEEQVQIEAKVGSQVARYSVKLSIYTCEAEIEFSDGLKVQKDVGIQRIPALKKVEQKGEGEENTSNCFKSKFKIIQDVKGIKIDSKSGEITIDTSEKIDKALLQVSVDVGSQVFESKALNIEVYDCNDYVSLPIIKDNIKVQQDSKVDPISFEATITRPDCKVEKYTLEGEMKGLSFDQTNGQLKVDTTIPGEPTELSVSLAIGSQVLTPKTFTFEIYDCLSEIKFSKLKEAYNFQKKEEETQEIDATPEFKRSECSVGSYLFSELPEGIKAIENSAKLTIDTSKSIQKTEIQIEVNTGSQTMKSPKFSIEVFDCAEIIQFTNSQKIQLDEPTKVISVIKENANIDFCGKVMYRIEGLVDGIEMDLQTGDLTIQTEKAIQNTALKVIVQVGEQTFESPQLEFEVFDCKLFVTKPSIQEKYKYQVDSIIPIIEMPFISTFPECVINSYDLSIQTNGITVDSTTAELTISNEKEIEPIQMHLNVRVGTQTISTEKFTIEVFDCNRYLGFLKDQYHQMDDTQDQLLDTLTSNDNPTDCVVSSFKASGLTDGISIDEESGKITLVTANAIEKRDLQLEVVAGAQTIFPPKFSIEVFDCSKAIKFVDTPRFQVSSESQSFNAIASNQRPKLCGDYTMTLGENTYPGITKGDKNGQIIVDTSQQLAKTSLQISLKVGVQDIPYEFADMEVYDCKNFIELPKLKDSYRYQVNQTIPSIDGKFKSTSDECVLTTYSLTQKNGQISIKSFSGRINIGNQQGVPQTKLQIIAKVGLQNIESEIFLIEVFDCILEINQPHLWNNHRAQADGVGYQLQKNVIIDARPETQQKDDCPIDRFNITGKKANYISIDQEKGIVEVDKDQVITKIQLTTTVYVGSQQIDLPYITIMPRKDERGINLFAIINSVIFLILVLVACVLCFCCKKQKQDEDKQKNKPVATKQNQNHDLEGKNEFRRKTRKTLIKKQVVDESKPIITPDLTQKTPGEPGEGEQNIMSQATDANQPVNSPEDSIDELQFDEEQVPQESNSVDQLTGGFNVSQTREPQTKKFASQIQVKNGTNQLS